MATKKQWCMVFNNDARDCTVLEMYANNDGMNHWTRSDVNLWPYVYKRRYGQRKYNKTTDLEKARTWSSIDPLIESNGIVSALLDDMLESESEYRWRIVERLKEITKWIAKSQMRHNSFCQWSKHATFLTAIAPYREDTCW